MKAPLQLVWAAALATAAWRMADAEEATTAATPSMSTVAGAGEGCAAVLLTASWALLTSRCLKGYQPYHLRLIAPGDVDGGPAPARAEDGGWRQWRRVAEVVRHANQADRGALEYPALALARVDRPFALGAALRPAPVLSGALDDARRPLRCNIEGWKVQKQNTSDASADSANFTEPTKSIVGTVLTHEQCRAHALVEQLSQFCVEVSTEPRLQDGSPLLCGGVLVGMQYDITRYHLSNTHIFYLFTNASDVQSWLGRNVPNLKLVSSNLDEALIDQAPKHSHVTKPAGARAAAAAAAAAVAASVPPFLPAALALLVVCTSMLDHTIRKVENRSD